MERSSINFYARSVLTLASCVPLLVACGAKTDLDFGATADVDVPIADWDCIDDPRELSSFDVTSRSDGDYCPACDCTAVSALGDLAFLTTRFDMRVVDLSEPSSPVEIGFNVEAMNSYDIEVHQDFVYVDIASALKIFDVRDPRSPRRVAILGEEEGDVAGFGFQGDLLFLLMRDDPSLVIYDVSDPTTPRELGRVPLPAASEVVVLDDFAFVMGYSTGLVVVDISEPTAPRLVSSLEPGGYHFGLAGSGHHLYLAGHEYCLRVIDVTDPLNPRVIGSYRQPEEFSPGCSNVHVANGYAFVSHHGIPSPSGGVTNTRDNPAYVRILETSDPENPIEVGHHPVASSIDDIETQDELMLVAAGGGGLRVVSLTCVP